MSQNTVRFAAEFDDTKLVQGLNNVKSELQAVSTSVSNAFANEPGIVAMEQDITGLQTELAGLEQSYNQLDSASTGLSGSFEEIGNAANQAGDNFNSMGTAGATIEQQLAEIGTTSVTAGQSMTALGGSADTAGTSMGALANNFAPVTGGLTDVNTLVPTLSDNFSTLGTEGETAGSKLASAWGKGSGIAVGISAAVSGVANLVRGFRDYQDSQLRVEKTTRTLGVQQLAAKDLQDKYNEAVAKYGANSQQAIDAGTKYQLKLDQIANTQEQLRIQVKRVGDAQVDTWLGVAGTVTGVGGSIMQVLTGIGGEKGLAGLPAKVRGVKDAFSEFGTVIGASGVLGTLMKIGAIVAGTFAGFAIANEVKKSIPVWEEWKGKLNEVLMTIPGYKEFGKLMATILPFMATDAEKAALGVEGFDKANEGAIQSGNNFGTSIKSLDNTVKGYIPTSKLFTESTRQIAVVGGTAEESYLRSAKSINYYGLEAQKSGTLVNALYAQFKAGTVITNENTGAITPNTKALADHGIALFDVGKAAETTNKSISGSTDIYTEWINKGVDPANAIIKELSASVKSGVLPQENLGKAVELVAAKMEAAGTVTDANKEQVIMLSTAYLKAITPVDKLEQTIAKAASTTGAYSDVLNDTIKPVNSIKDALEAGSQKFNDLETSTQSNIITTKQYRNELIQWLSSHNALNPAIEMTTSNLELQYKAQHGDIDAITQLNKLSTEWANKVQEVATKYNTELNPALIDTPEKLEAITKALEEHQKALEESKQAVEDARQSFSELLDATKVKDFNKALKEMNLDEALGKPFEKAVKRMGPSFAALKVNLNNVELGLKGLIQFGAKVDFTTFSNGLDMWVDSLENLVATDVDTSTEKMDNLIQSIRQMTPAELQQHAGSLTSLITAMANGKNISSKEVEDFFTQFSNEKVVNVGTAADNADKLGTNAATAAPKLDSVASALESVNLAAKDVATKMSTLDFQFAPPKLDQVVNALQSVTLAAVDVTKKMSTMKYNIAAPNIKPATDAILKVAKAFDTLVNGINKAKPTININNSQAISAINKVVSAMNNIKNVSRTITITTVYKTVGTKATNTRIGTNTRVGTNTNTNTNTRISTGGGEGITETPIMALSNGGGTVGMSNTIAGGGGGTTGDVNVIINMRDEFGIEKQRKFKAVLGKNRYIFGAVGSGG